MNIILAALGLAPAPQPSPEPVRFYAATKAENAAARSKRTEVHLLLAVEAAVLTRTRLLTPRELGDGKGRGRG